MMHSLTYSCLGEHSCQYTAPIYPIATELYERHSLIWLQVKRIVIGWPLLGSNQKQVTKSLAPQRNNAQSLRAKFVGLNLVSDVVW